MTDYSTNASIVYGLIGTVIIERRLQNGGWKYNFVKEWIVIGVDRLRSHLPLSLIHRLAQFGEFASGLVFTRIHNIDKVRSRFRVFTYGQSHIISPGFGISNFYCKGLQLFQGHHFSRVRHPLQVLDSIGKSQFNILDHFHGLLLGLRRERLFHI